MEAIKGAAETTETVLGYVEKARESVKAVDAALKKIPGADWLISKVSGIFAKATHQALDATVSATQKLGHAIPKASGQRRGDDVGSFSKPYNIQLSRHSAALYGWKNGFVYGGKNVTVSSAGSASVLGRKRVDIKSTSLVEVAAPSVFATGKTLVDIHSSEAVHLIAHPGAKKMPTPDGASMALHAKKSILARSTDADVDLKARKSIHLEAKENDVDVKADKNVKVTAATANIELKGQQDVKVVAQEGTLDLSAATAGARLASKGDMFVKSQGKMTVESAGDMKWKAADFQLSGKKVKIKGSKIHLQ